MLSGIRRNHSLWWDNPQKINGISFYRFFTQGIVNQDKGSCNLTQDELLIKLASFDLGINVKLDSNL
jgi:hypothetical protein